MMEPFSEALARRVWARLKRERKDGGLFEAHPYYCGHGLVRSARGVALVTVEDARPHQVLKEWRDEASFVAFWAAQTDASCGGGDPAAPLFYTNDEWARDNQRLTRARLESYAPR